jgi:hypothetical protein
LDNVQSTKPLTCKPGEKVIVTVDASMRIDGPRNDLGWYVAADGGDALTGKCIVNGLQSAYNYPLVHVATSPSSPGKVVWFKKDGGDDDMCGDVTTSAAAVQLKTHLLVNAQLPCVDDNEDGILDVAMCFTWRSDASNDGACDLSENIPGSVANSCFCTRYDIKNIVVETPPAKPC